MNAAEPRGLRRRGASLARQLTKRLRGALHALPFLLLGALPLGCHEASPRLPAAASRAQPTLDDVARHYVRLALALGERDRDSLDFATSSAAWATEAHREYSPLSVISQGIEQARTELQQISAATGPSERATQLQLQLESLSARASMLEGRLLPFDAEAAALFHIARLPDTHATRRAAVQREIATLLPPSARARSLAQRLALFQQQFVVAPEHLPAVMNAALTACRASTAAHIALPPDEAVAVQYIRNQPWSGFSHYDGHAHSTVSINLDFPLSVDDVLELACHEAYPGHHVFNTLRDLQPVPAEREPERDVQPTFSPQSCVSEAAAAFAPRLAFSLAERTAVERDVLFPLAKLQPALAARHVRLAALVRELASAEPVIARAYLDGSLEFVRAEQSFAEQVLMANAEAALLYLNEYRSYVLAYTDGPQRVAALVGSGPDRWARYECLMHRFVVTIPSPAASADTRSGIVRIRKRRPIHAQVAPRAYRSTD